MKKSIILLFATLVGLSVAGCEKTADQRQAAATEKMAMEADTQVGIPAIKNWREKRMMRMLYELRDSEVNTFTYVKNMDGSLSFLCASVGYGLPYATQFTNPLRYHTQGLALPQAEPNGLFMPNQAEASWAMCVDPADGKVKPIYVEERLMISPFALKAKESYTGQPAPAPEPVKK